MRPRAALQPAALGVSRGARWATRQALAAAFCFAFVACRRDANVNLERGDRLLGLGQNKQALVEYQTALNLESTAHAHRGLGLAYEALSAYGEAQRHLEAALEAKPMDTAARVALARVNTRFGHYDKARAELQAALEQEPSHDAALLLLGIYAETRPQVQQAIDLLEAQLERQRRLGNALSHESQLVLADLLARINRVEAADQLRASIRHSALGNVRLTLDLARASSDRDNHELCRQLLLPLVERHPSDSHAWQSLAAAAIELGRLGEARDALKRLTASENEPEVRLLRARLGLESGLETEPTAELRALLAAVPADQQHERARLRRFLADALANQRQYEEAEQQLTALITEVPRDIEGSLALAELHLQRGKAEQAIELLSALTDHHGRLARAYQILGRAYLETAQLNAAEQAFRRVWELAPHEPGARYWLAQTLQRRGQTDQARRLLEGNLKRFATHAKSVASLADVLEESAGAAAARTFLIGHARQHSASAEVANVEAAWLMAHADPEHALAAYRRALAINPSFFPAVLALSEFYARRDKSNLAHSVIDGALAHNRTDLQLFLLAARVSGDLKLFNHAREYCESALQLSPDHPIALAELAKIHSEGFRDFRQAKELAAKAYAAAPARPEVLDAVGWVTHLGGESAQAVPLLERAAQQEPENPRFIYHWGAALLAAGQADAANEQLARVLRLDPMFPTAKEIRTLLARR